MKHADLVRMIRRGAAWAGLGRRRARQGGEHEIWDLDGLMIVIPRQREVNEVTTGSILRHLEAKLGPDWWRR